PEPVPELLPAEIPEIKPAEAEEVTEIETDTEIVPVEIPPTTPILTKKTEPEKLISIVSKDIPKTNVALKIPENVVIITAEEEEAEEPEEIEIPIETEPEPVHIPEPKIEYMSIFDSIRDEALTETQQFILDGADPNQTDGTGTSPLYTAAETGNELMIRLLLKHGADPSTANAEGRLPIHAAAELSYEMASLLAGKGNLIFSLDSQGKNIIGKALLEGPKAVSELLGEELVNTKDINGNTPMHLAAEMGSVENVRQLLTNGADINIRNNEELLPLDIAFGYTHSDIHVQVVEELIRNYSDIPSNQDFYYAFQAISNTGVESRFENGATVLHYTASYNHLALMSMFIKRGAYLEARDENNNTPIHTAVEYGNLEILELLILSGVDVDARNGSSSTPLHLAISKIGKKEIVEYLLDNGADIDSRNVYGDTALHIAVDPGVSSDFVELLLLRGADPNSRDKTGNTPIMLALAQNNRPAVELLLNNDADLYAKNYNEITPLIRSLMKGIDVISWFYSPEINQTVDAYGNTPLHTAINNGAMLDVIEFIINSGADLDKKNFLGDTALHSSVEVSYADAAALLVQYGADPFLSNNRGKAPAVLAFDQGIDFTSMLITPDNLLLADTSGNTPIHMAVQWDYPEIVSYLIEQGANINVHNFEGFTPIHYAVKNNSIKICQVLMNNGALINARDSYSNTPLHTAISWESVQAAKFLLLRGANVHLRNLSGNTPLHTAVLQRDQNSVKMLIEYNASLESRDNMGRTPLLLSARKNYWEISELLISLGADFNARDDRGNTPLHEAIRKRNEKISTLLIEQGAAIFAENRYGDTPIGIAFTAGVDVVDWFIQGFSISARDDKGNTPLHAAIQKNSSEDIINLLIHKGADINSRNNWINTPLHTAFLSLNKNAVLILIDAGADIFSRNGDGNSPLSIAFSMGTDTISWIVTPENKNVTDQYGNTPLHIAAFYGNIDAVNYLVSIGISAGMKNLAGDTPADMAKKQDHWEIEKMLREME
ncbi:MAG: ankyrin repeat domain-containing protein, partial [Spirochaetales bacterium]|nr:ankyrin repeat domain-containing protein [Spirochaetales bacterium]